MRICAADVLMDVRTTDTAFFEQRFAEYACADTRVPQLYLSSAIVPHIDPPAGRERFAVRRAHMLELPDGQLCHYMVSEDTNEIFQLTQYTPDFSHIAIRLCPPAKDALSATDYEYVYTGYEFSNRLAVLGGAVMHGSAIAYRGEGIIFSAPSGTGKSTHTGLWKQCFGDEVMYVNDDKPALRFSASGVTMYGTPWSGKTALNHQVAVPLRAIVFVERGETNAMRRLAFTESMLHISEELVRPYHDEKLGEKLVDVMVRLAQTVPVWMLTCTMDPAAAVTARDAIFKD